ncbi:hypothetical protein [Microbacterium sp. SLBN-111]|uniref:hypothetical protein n=1 Tax=Microbacterium sp. SLBN-111 TaxID=3377733 RepID=UPI003C764A5B
MTSVTELFEVAQVAPSGVVRWGDRVLETRPGVYVVSTSAEADETVGLDACPLDPTMVRNLLRARPEATVHGESATSERLSKRLRQTWPAREPVVYIGLAGTSVAKRVQQFYATKLGARAPHAGGWPVKMLRAEHLWVHFGVTDDVGSAESAMIARFTKNLPIDVREGLIDPHNPLPFANLTVPRGRRKVHGLAGFKAERSR